MPLIPAKAGTQAYYQKELDSRFRGNERMAPIFLAAHQGPLRLLPSAEAPREWAGGLEPGVLGGLHRHSRALAEGAQEHNPFAGCRCELVQHSSRADLVL